MELTPEKKRKLFLGILIGLAALLVLLAAVIISLGGASSEEPGESYSGASVPTGELLVDDVYEGETLIPLFDDLKKNSYDNEKFREINGYLRYDDPNARLGVDVSEYQGEVDWSQVKAAGIDFAILRLGYRGMTQGLLNRDACFETNLAEAADAGLFVGVYFYSQAITEAEAEAEADFVIETLDGRGIAYPVFFDWEQPSPYAGLPQDSYRVYGMTGSEISRCAVAFCERIKAAGYTPGVYSNKSLAYEFFDMSQWPEYDLWYAEYKQAPSLYYDFRLWQYTDKGTVPGINGGVDMNICFKPY